MWDDSELRARFWAKVDKGEGDGCWVWTGALVGKGYGNLRLPRLNGERQLGRAHRVSWEMHFGEIPDGLFVCHQCDNRPCIRPSHLYLGTNSQNLKDAVLRGLAAAPVTRGTDNVRSKLTDEIVLDIRRRHAAGESKHSLARLYGIGMSTVGHVVSRRTWAHV